MEQSPFDETLTTMFTGALTARDRAVDLYGALCNMRWQRGDEPPVSVTWRQAGDIVADLRGAGEGYLDYYCAGNEGVVASWVAKRFAAAGWHPAPWPEQE